MFSVHDHHVTITRGDSALLTLRFFTHHRFTADDRAVLTLRRPRHGPVLLCEVLTIREDGFAQAPLTCEMTKNWPKGFYEWDVRLVLDATLDEKGNVTGGREVITPMRPGRFDVIYAAGDV